MDQKTIVPPASVIFRTFDDGFTVRSMTPADSLNAQGWMNSIGLAVTPLDLPMLLDLYPPGSPVFYVGEFEGKIVASMIQVPWSENVLYLTYFYVEEKFRGRGFGSRLLNGVAREHAGDRIVVLDSVEGWVVGAYTSWGFVEAFKLEQMRCVAQSTYDVDSFDGKIVSSEKVDFEHIIRYDNKCFVSKDFPTRKNLLRKLIDIPTGATFVAVNGSGSVVGFGCRRPCTVEGHHLIGPLYADDRTIAEAIMAKLCSEVSGDHVNIDICVPNEAAVGLAEKFQFEHVTFLHRMHRNGDPKEFKAEVFAVTSIEYCGF